MQVQSEKPVGKTGGRFNPNEPNSYFMASDMGHMIYASKVHSHLLIAINELNTPREFDQMERLIKAGKTIFLDSGIYDLAMRHAEAHGLTHDQALNTAPEDMDNFEALYTKYLSIVGKYGDQLWGYIELDMGGRENKIKTRAKLEAQGLRPIPVYHPFGDGWEYFDELCSKYDRICCGNLVRANAQTRKRLMATIWERKRKYPHVWIHLLGVTPNQWSNAYPINSADSSSWLSALKWSGYHERTALQNFSEMNLNYRYELGSDSSSVQGSNKATQMSAYGCYMNERNWRNHFAAVQQAGMELYPK